MSHAGTGAGESYSEVYRCAHLLGAITISSSGQHPSPPWAGKMGGGDSEGAATGQKAKAANEQYQKEGCRECEVDDPKYGRGVRGEVPGPLWGLYSSIYINRCRVLQCKSHSAAEAGK
ncbi:hypothetical protein FKM82_028543 [Ascaphus truei]